MYDLCTSTNGKRRTHKKLEKEERTVHDILKYCCVAGDWKSSATLHGDWSKNTDKSVKLKI